MPSTAAPRRVVSYFHASDFDILNHLHSMMQPSFGRMSVSDVIRLAVSEANAARALPGEARG